MSADNVTFDPVDPRSAPARWAMDQYFAELDDRFPEGFDPGDAHTSDPPAFSAPNGVLLVAHDGDEPIGCGAVQRIDHQIGEIKRMWIHPDWRRRGMGRRLLERLETAASELGYERVQLDTNNSLTEAIAMYERAGYQPIDRYNDNPYARHWFAKDL